MKFPSRDSFSRRRLQLAELLMSYIVYPGLTSLFPSSSSNVFRYIFAFFFFFTNLLTCNTKRVFRNALFMWSHLKSEVSTHLPFVWAAEWHEMGEEGPRNISGQKIEEGYLTLTELLYVTAVTSAGDVGVDALGYRHQDFGALRLFRHWVIYCKKWGFFGAFCCWVG